MFPRINKKSTGINIRMLMDQRGLTVKDVQQYLQLGSIQSVYHWLNGVSLPSVDNLYALSQLFQISIDEIICGNKRKLIPRKNLQSKRLYEYCVRLNRLYVA